MTNIEFVIELIKLHDKDARYPAIELVYNYYGALIIENNFNECNKILVMVNFADFKAWLLMPFLTLSFPHYRQLPELSQIILQASIDWLEYMEKDMMITQLKRFKRK